MNQDYFDANRKLWNTRTSLHLDSNFYDVAAFKSGQSSLCGIEQQELGRVDGKTILHLQCHFGLDTLSLARLGAKVTGVDFSETAIEAAGALAAEANLDAEFICANVLELPDHLDGQFDIVFTTFGVVGWLPGLNRWSQVIHQFLKPGGMFYFLEFHKHFMQLNEQGEITYNYFHTEQPDEETTTTTYADNASHPPRKEYWWNHTMSDIFMAVTNAGLLIRSFREFPYSAYKLNDHMVELSPRHYVHERLRERIPYMFSLIADKPWLEQDPI